MGETEREFLEALGKLAENSGMSNPFRGAVYSRIILEQISSDDIWSEAYAPRILRDMLGGQKPTDRRVELRLIFQAETPGWRDAKYQEYDYEGTAEEITDDHALPTPRKELPSGQGS